MPGMDLNFKRFDVRVSVPAKRPAVAHWSLNFRHDWSLADAVFNTSSTVDEVRPWRAFDVEAFACDLLQSCLICVLSNDTLTAFSKNNSTLQSLLDHRAPFAMRRGLKANVEPPNDPLAASSADIIDCMLSPEAWYRTVNSSAAPLPLWI